MPEKPPMPAVESVHQKRPPVSKRPLVDTEEEPERKKLKLTKHQPKSRLESLPAELFCHVLSFVGPTSSSLVALTEVNKNLNRTMNAIGNAMLQRARSNFRIPLEPRSPVESCTSLFVRHARTCSDILTKLAHLRELLCSLQSDPQSSSNSDTATMDKAMDMALSLLEVGPTLSISLERQILSTCGKCGGMAFKSSKSKVVVTTSTTTNVAHDDTTDSSSSSSSSSHLAEQQSSHNQERLDMARLIMQMVVFRDLQISKQQQQSPPSNLTNLVRQNQAVMKKSFAMGCV